jgi:hypothetical protein
MTRVIATLLVVAVALTGALLFAAEKEARVTVLIHDVKLLPEDAQARAATLNETVHDDTAVRTGTDSRSELTFVDLTITRLGSNTVFSFNKAGRSVRLNGGAMLLCVPKNSGGASLKTDACSVAISGTTVVLEATRSGRNKLYVLEGNARMALNKRPNDWSRVAPGQMLDVPAGADTLPAVQNFDVDRFMQSNSLITDFPELPSRHLISASAGNPNERVYESQPVAGGPAPPGPPFIRPPRFPPGRGGRNPPNSGGGSTGTGGVKAPKKPKSPNVKGQTAGAIANQATPSPSPRKRKTP